MPIRRRRESRDYRDAVLATNPAGYWRLGEASGTVARDEMGLYHGTYVGSPTLGVPGLLAGDPGTAVTFAAGKYVTIPVPTGAVGTIGLWVARSRTLAGEEDLFDAGSLGIAGSFIANKVTGVRQDTAVFMDSGAVTTVDTVPHFVVVRWAASPGIYVDGVDVTNITNAARPIAKTALTIAANYLHGNGFVGTIGEFALWNRIPTAAEIAELYRIGMGR